MARLAVIMMVVVVMVMRQTTAHDWDWGQCPTIEPFLGLEPDRLLGQWYVIEQYDTTSTCLTMNFTRTSPTQLKVVKSRQLVLLDTISIENLNTYSATLDIPDGDNAGRMRVKWALNLAGKADFTVFDTDYSSYMAMYECQQLTTLGHRQSASILSRNPLLDAIQVTKLKQQLRSAGIDTHHFSKIDHSECIRRDEADVNIDIDENTFKQLISGASESFQTIATTLINLFQVAHGATNFANTVVDMTRQLASSKDGSSGSAPIIISEEIEIIS